MQRMDVPRFNAHQNAGQQYLESMVLSASPARLRMLLLQKGVDVSAQLSATWRDASERPESADRQGPNEWSLALLDVITELLAGVTSDEAPVCKQVADLYVFLSQHLLEAEATSDANKIDAIQRILKIELETWTQVCAAETPVAAPIAVDTSALSGYSAGLNLQG